MVVTGARARLLHTCERAKIDLSTLPSAKIYVSDYFATSGDNDIDYTLGQTELEDIVGPLLEKGFRRIAGTLEAAGYAAEQVALCIGTGGMSNMPAVRRRLHELFGPQRVEIPDSAGILIAEGAAWIAADDARVRLAKHVELVLSRNSHLPLVKAGTAMPRKGVVQQNTFHLYCTDPRDGEGEVSESVHRNGPATRCFEMIRELHSVS